MTDGELLIQIASKYIGVHDGDPLISEFRKSIGGQDVGQPWCVDFIWYCLKQMKRKSDLLRTDSAMGLWTHSNVRLRVLRPEVGTIMIWNFQGTSKGHAGIVKEVSIETGFVKTIEGNTTSSEQVARLGDGVYEKKRHIIAPPGPMVVMGWLRPWLLTSVPQH